MTAFSRGDIHAGTAPNGEGRKTPGATRRGLARAAPDIMKGHKKCAFHSI
ncbi:hypothetical protein GLE_3480 [Lysobacter enzymogenes]|uniref:Uncharacterized protein n=1 Tax=Lysobacter enzymogenes TaxID=69 RepID=A0A0S2DK56_LYSEN|nr:hypothetical protein GLE_3480 [Lysobacter enzymogenes]